MSSTKKIINFRGISKPISIYTYPQLNAIEDYLEKSLQLKHQAQSRVVAQLKSIVYQINAGHGATVDIYYSHIVRQMLFKIAGANDFDFVDLLSFEPYDMIMKQFDLNHVSLYDQSKKQIEERLKQVEAEKQSAAAEKQKILEEESKRLLVQQQILDAKKQKYETEALTTFRELFLGGVASAFGSVVPFFSVIAPPPPSAPPKEQP